MPGRFVSARKEVMAQLKLRGSGAVNTSAHRLLETSKELVPQPGRSRGYATGALAASGYVATEGGGTGAYSEAIAAAEFASDARILRRDQIMPPTVPYPEPGKAKAIVDYPLTYASLIEHGFWHILAERHIIGVAFLQSAVNAQFPEFIDRIAHVLKQLELIEPTAKIRLTAAERQESRRAAYESSARATARSQVRVSSQAQFEELRARVGSEFLAPEKGEQMVEAWWRIKNRAEEIKGT